MPLRARFYAFCAVALVQIGLALVLICGLRIEMIRQAEKVNQLVDFALADPPTPLTTVPLESAHHLSAAAKAEPDPVGGSLGRHPAQLPLSVAPVVALEPSAPPSGEGFGGGPAIGVGLGGGEGGNGSGDSGEGTDLEQIAGEIRPSDYPHHLGNAGLGGRVGVLFTVGVNGRVTHCSVTRSSGVPELDALTCRLILKRFRYRPSTDPYGRPVSDEVEGEHIWEAADDTPPGIQ